MNGMNFVYLLEIMIIETTSSIGERKRYGY